MVLHGFNNKHDTGHVDQAIKDELDRLIANDGLKNRVMKIGEGKFDRIDGGSFNLTNSQNLSKSAGPIIARSIYQVMGATQ